MYPQVSFIIPCYKLAHFLAACVNSILAQTYLDFEVLILDDCSPDNTAEVAAGFKDPRVRYLRNEVNLGHIRNYNKGIELARGSYIWLISADDSLRSQNVLQKFVGLLEQNPQIGYVFCPAMSLRDGEEIGVEGWTNWPGNRDRILSGRELLIRSLTACPVCAPAGLVRKECYKRLGLFPLNLPRSGDHYLWAAFATVYDAGYFSEPMVHYRHHATNMDDTMSIENPSLYFEQELLVIWMIKKEVEKAGIFELIRDYQRRLAELYARMVVYQEAMNREYGYSLIDAQREIAANVSGWMEAREIVEMLHEILPARLTSGHTQAGISYYKLGDLKQAIASFRSALAVDPWSLKPRIYLLSSLLERICGIRLIPLLKLLKNTLQRSLTQS
ncbi:MAG: glycosyltransferase [Blastocatellia bacterium]|nr:glycosyltransferase [Blastocatellia bacterium]